jgi:hypothetical protein
MDFTNLIPSIPARSERSVSRATVWVVAIVSCVVVNVAVMLGLFGLIRWIADLPGLQQLIVPVIGVTIAAIAIASAGKRAWHRGLSLQI